MELGLIRSLPHSLHSWPTMKLAVVVLLAACVFAEENVEKEKKYRLATDSDVEFVRKWLDLGVTDCTLCHVFQHTPKEGELYEKIEFGLQEKCELLPTKYHAPCGLAMSRLAARMAAFVQEKASSLDCPSLCSNPQPVLNRQNLCAVMQPIHRDMDSYLSTVVEDASEMCAREKNPFQCKEGLKKTFGLVTGFVKRMWIRFLYAADPVELCGADLSLVSGADKVVADEAIDTNPLVCNLCHSFAHFLHTVVTSSDTLTAHEVQEAIAGVLVKVCKLIDLPAMVPMIKCDQELLWSLLSAYLLPMIDPMLAEPENLCMRLLPKQCVATTSAPSV